MDRYRILIVDDRESNIISLREVLKQIKNIEILEATSGEMALEILLQKRVDLTLLDIQMPKMDGFEVATYMKKLSQTKSIPIIFLTAFFRESEFIQRGYKLGAVDYLLKPIDETRLINKISLYSKLHYREQIIKEQKRELNTIFESLPIGIALISKSFGIERANQNFTNLTKLARGDRVESLTQSENLKLEDRNLRVKFTNIENSKEQICLTEDITEYLKLKQEREEQDEYINYQSRFMAMGEVVSMIAHQWRQPLNAISSSVADLKIKESLNKIDRESLLERLDSIENSTQKLSKIISDFMEFSKSDVKKENFNLRELIESILTLLSGKLKKLEIEFKNLVDREFTIFGHRGLMEQVILNLITNSLEAYQERETKKRYIQIESIQRDKHFYISYQDFAGGVKPELLEKVFTPYFSTKNSGTGLGLYMIKRIIQRSFNGDVELLNRDEGLRINIFLVRKRIEH